MRKVKRMIAAALALVMAAGMTACSGSAAPAPAAAAPAEGGKKIQPVEIEFWHALPESQGGTIITEICDEFSKTNEYGITVKDVYCADFYQGIARDLQASVAAGVLPGVTMIGYQFLNYFDENFPQITNISKFIEDHPEEKAWLDENFTERTLELTRSNNDNILGLPYCASQAVLYYNKDMFREAGLDPDNPPKTIDEMYEAAKAITEKTGEYGIYLGYPLDTWIQESMCLSNGGEMYKMEDGKCVPTFNSPEHVEVWSKFQDFYTNGYSTPMTFEEGCSAFISGKFGMTLNTCARINMFSTNATFDLGTCEFPVFNPDLPLRSCVAGNMVGIIAEDENKQLAAWEFIKYLFSVDNAAKIVMKTGYVPTVKDLEERSPELKESFEHNEYIKPAINTFNNNANRWTSWPGANGLQVSQILIDMKDEIITTDVDVETLLNETADKVYDLLN